MAAAGRISQCGFVVIYRGGVFIQLHSFTHITSQLNTTTKHPNPLHIIMDEKRCSTCAKKLPLSLFLANTSADMTSKVFATCISCRERSRSKRKAAQPPSHPRQHSKHTSIDYCSRCQHTLLPSASTSISINLGDNTLKTCSSCQYRSRRDSILPSAIPPIPESSALANAPPQPPIQTIPPLPASRPLLFQPVSRSVVP